MCRMLKCQCKHCGFTIRVARGWLQNGKPFCPEGYPLEVCAPTTRRKPRVTYKRSGVKFASPLTLNEAC